MPLTDAAARQAKYDGKELKLSDEKGLYLLVRKSGKYWKLKYRFAGKEQKLSLGVYPDVSLKEARQKRDAARDQLADGMDPGLVRKQEKLAASVAAENCLESVAREWFAAQSGRWKPSHADGVLRSLEKDLFPIMGALPVDAITPPQVLALLRRIESRGSFETASRICQRMGAVMRFAIQTGRATYNPVADMRGTLTTTKTTHRPAMPTAELPEFFRRLAVEPMDPITRVAFRLLMLTMCRPGEIRFAEWAEFDTAAELWRIPAAKMKMARDHLVPLSRQVLALLDELRQITGHQRFLFPNVTTYSKPMSENTLGRAMRRMGYSNIATAHGFRGTASTLLNEQGFNSDWIERQLAHVESNAVRRAYNAAEHLDDRRKMLQWLADYYECQEHGGNVLPVNFNRTA